MDYWWWILDGLLVVGGEMWWVAVSKPPCSIECLTEGMAQAQEVESGSWGILKIHLQLWHLHASNCQCKEQIEIANQARSFIFEFVKCTAFWWNLESRWDFFFRLKAWYKRARVTSLLLDCFAVPCRYLLWSDAKPCQESLDIVLEPSEGHGDPVSSGPYFLSLNAWTWSQKQAMANTKYKCTV